MNSRGVLNGEVVLTWRNSFKAGELDTITPPSITALREERESPVRELERCGADRWIDSLQAEGEGGKKEGWQRGQKRDRLLVAALTKWRDEGKEINKESVTQSEWWPQRGGKGRNRSNWVTEVRDGLHQDCCPMVRVQAVVPLVSLFLPLGSGKMCLCVSVCVWVGAHGRTFSLSNDTWAIHRPPMRATNALAHYTRPWSILANVLLKKHHCPLLTALDWPKHSFTELCWSAPGVTRDASQLPSQQIQKCFLSVYGVHSEQSMPWCILRKV